MQNLETMTLADFIAWIGRILHLEPTHLVMMGILMVGTIAFGRWLLQNVGSEWVMAGIFLFVTSLVIGENTLSDYQRIGLFLFVIGVGRAWYERLVGDVR